MVHSGCIVIRRLFCSTVELKLYTGRMQMKMTATSGIQKFAEGEKTLVKILGVVNTGRPLQVKYWVVATPATPAALTPMKFHFNLGLNFGLDNCDVKQRIYT